MADGPSLQPAFINCRSKPQLSCHLCRRRKLRCDRKQPCSTCVNRGLAISCAYPNNQAQATPQGRRARLPETHKGRPQATVKERLSQLEQIVVSLMQKTGSDGPEQADQHSVSSVAQGHHQGGSPDGTINTQDSPTQSDAGSAFFSSSDAYVGGTHWSAILDGIAGIKEQLERENDENIESPASTLHTLLLYGCKSASKEDILATLPHRPAVDRYISQYFNRLDLAPSCLHSGQFLGEYERFWENPSQTSVMWLGLLFSMICLAVLASNATGSSSDPGVHNPLVDRYREKIVQCLVLGEYTKSGRYTFETLYHYLTIEYSIRKDADRDLWVLSGILVNIALRMGYHRDSSHFPGISVFEGEMRRRIWATILQGDILISTQMGMPRMIKDWQCDTVEPHNLNDSDFDEGCSELPPSRPETEITTVSNLIARRRIFAALGAIVDFTASVRPVTYDEVMRLDRILHDAEATVPNYLRIKTMATAVTDPPQVVMHRLFLRLMFYKGQVMLHCKYLSPELAAPADGKTLYFYSRTSCIEAALGILDVQKILDEETGPEGQLYTMRWRASSFMRHEFLTATMLLCFLARQAHGNPDADRHNLDETMAALTRGHSIWLKSRDSSVEAKTAADTLNIVLGNQSGNSNMNTESQDINNDFAMDLALPLSYPAQGLSGNGPEENFYCGLPFMGASQTSPNSAMMMDSNLAWQWQKYFEMELPQDAA